jgi:hypothetical protein
MWSDLDHYKLLELEHYCVAKVKRWIERRRVIEFLKRLNPEFEGRRAAMFHQPTLPTLDGVVAAMAQDELRRKVMSGGMTPTHPTYAIIKTNETRECFNCGEKGHNNHDCRIPRKYNYGRGRWSNRGGRGPTDRVNRGRGYGNRSDHKANMTTLEGSSSDPTSNVQHTTGN